MSTSNSDDGLGRRRLLPADPDAPGVWDRLDIRGTGKRVSRAVDAIEVEEATLELNVRVSVSTMHGRWRHARCEAARLG